MLLDFPQPSIASIQTPTSLGVLLGPGCSWSFPQPSIWGGSSHFATPSLGPRPSHPRRFFHSAYLSLCLLAGRCSREQDGTAALRDCHTRFADLGATSPRLIHTRSSPVTTPFFFGQYFPVLFLFQCLWDFCRERSLSFALFLCLSCPPGVALLPPNHARGC